MNINQIGNCLNKLVPEDPEWLPLLNLVSYVALATIISLGIGYLSGRYSHAVYQWCGGAAMCLGMLAVFFAAKINKQSAQQAARH